MTTTSQKLNRICRNFITVVALPAVVAILGTASASAGAIFTTDVDCVRQNVNIYVAKEDVWVHGNGFEPNTIYCVVVSEPKSDVTLSPLGTVTTDQDGNFCEQLLTTMIASLDTTTNPGGEYKVIVCVPGDCEQFKLKSAQCSKSDNFKLKESCSGDCQLTIMCRTDDLGVPCTTLNAQTVDVCYDLPNVSGGVGQVAVVCTPPSCSPFSEGTTPVSCTATDQAGTIVSCGFNVVIGTCPSCALTCPDSITNCTDSGTCTFVYNFPPLSCPDAPGVTITCTNESGTVVTPTFLFPLGKTTVTCTASPAVPGSPCSFTVTVKDCVGPTITCPSASFDLGCNPTLPDCALAKTKVSGVSDICDANPTLCCVAGTVQNGTGCARSQIFDVKAKDASGNESATCHVTFTWTADINPPAITCPAAKNVQCETFTPVTTVTSISLTDFRALGGTISDDCGSPTLTYKDSGPVGDCPKVYTRTYTATDGCQHTATCTQKINCFCASLVTDTARCTLLQPCDSSPGFRMIFTQDPLNLSCYKLTASNPGQFYYNAFHVGLSGEAVTFTVTLPYPFVTQGANPIEVYDSVNFSTANGQTCFTPGTKILPLSNQVTLATYGANPVVGVTTTSFTVTVPATVNDTGFVWLAVHLDYGLKGQSFGQNTTTFAATQCGGTTVLIPNNQTYNFSVVNGSAGNSTIKSCNTFKKLPGIGGLVCDSVTTRMISGVSVALKDSTGKVLTTGTTDQDGWYMCTYKWAGKAVTLNVGITPAGYKAQTKAVTLKSNGYAEVDFTCP